MTGARTMTPASVLLGLADAIEMETIPNRNLDAAVALAINLGARGILPDDHEYLVPTRPSDHCEAGTYWFKCRSGMSLRTAPAYTGSLDAAATLVPEGLWAEGSLARPSALEIHAPMTYDPLGRGHAATPALALTAASLRAHAALAERQEGGR